MSETVIILGPAGMEREAIKKSVEITGEFRAVTGGSLRDIQRRQLPPDGIACVLQMYGLTGRADQIRTAPAASVPVRMLVETAGAPDAWLIEGLRNGAVAVVAWPCLVNELRTALAAAGRGCAQLTPRVGSLLIGDIRKGQVPRIWELKLTPRQREIAKLLRAGRTNKQISKALGVAVGTVECHLTRIFRRLGVQSRAEAAVHLQVEAAVPPAGRLTAVEQRVVAEVLKGRGNDNVADRLELSRHTVEAHLTRAYQKLGVRNRLELIARLGDVT